MSGKLLDTYPAGSTIYALFDTFGSSGQSITLTGLAVTDVEIYKNGSVTQRASDAGIALLDTDGIDFDAITGIHGISIDLSDNTDASFYAVGSQYTVVISSVTIDSQTVSFILGSFRIVAAEGTAGYPAVDMARISNDATAADNLETMLDGTGGQTLSLGKLSIVNSAGDAIVATSSGGNGCGMILTGNGSGEGLKAAGGTTGNGAQFTGGLTSGSGLVAHAQTDGYGIDANGTGSGKAGLRTLGDYGQFISGGTEAIYLDGATSHTYVRKNTAQAGAAGTITLDSGASATDDFYNNSVIHIVDGTGAGQSRIISDYVGGTKVATVNGNWAVNPSSDSEFIILPFGAVPGASAPTASEVADAVWDEAAAGHVTAGTFGKLAADIESQTDDIGVSGAGLTAVPWNAAWDAEVQSEVADALTAYDPPTNAEMEARTLASASYATATALGTVDTVVDAIKAVTDLLPDAGALTSLATAASIDALPTAAENATAVLTTAMTESYSTKGGTKTVAQALYEIAQMLGEKSVNDVTLTVKKLDGTTAAATFTLDDATAPTSIARAT